MISAQKSSYALWIIWYFSWWMAAFWASRPKSRPQLNAGAAHRLLAVAGVVLLFLTPARPHAVATGGPLWQPLVLRLWTAPPAVNWAFVVLLVVSFAFCWWARVHLGALWSGFVTTKADHRVVDTGPYRWVRHPIYTGVISAAFWTACVRATPCAFCGFGLIAVSFWITASIEESFLQGELGQVVYDAYRQRTPMLLPW